MANLEDRIFRLEAESQIRQLIARYCFHLDHREIDSIGGLFTEDATLRSMDGVMNAQGADAIVEQFHGRFDVLGPGQHVMHDLQLDFVGDGKAEATGRVAGHGELLRGGRMMVTAMRYDDCYRYTDAGWRFAARVISFLYYVPVSEYGTILASRDRNHAYGAPRPAEFPEQLPTWIAYERSRGRS